MAAHILCGPVVGLVTSTSANVLLDIDQSCDLEMILRCKTTEQSISKITQFTENGPRVFKFDTLDENATYEITVPSIDNGRKLGTVQTLPEDVLTFKAVVVSCDRIEDNHPNKNQWSNLYQRAVKNNANVVLHIGDNVYMDSNTFAKNRNEEIVGKDDIAFDPNKVDQESSYIKARRCLRGLQPNEWEGKRDEILHIYRNRYRQCWSVEYKAKVLANFSNLMILDDHDIRNDFGSLPNDSDPNDEEFFLGKIALQVYHEYQRQLWDADILERDTNKLSNEFYHIDLGPVRIIMTDQRTSQSVYKHNRREGDDSHYGEDQTDALMTAITDAPSSTRMQLLVSPLPIVYMKKKVLMLFEKLVAPDDVGTFINKNRTNDLKHLLEAISQRKKHVGPGGDIIAFAGDIHMGGFSDIYEGHGQDRQLLIRQITSSAIHNRHFLWYAFAGVRSAMHFTDTFEEFTYAHYDWVATCNFTELHIDFTDLNKIVYSVNLVHEKGIESRSSTEKNWDHGIKTTSSCCNVM